MPDVTQPLDAKVASNTVEGVDNPGADNLRGGTVNLLGTTATLTTGTPIGNQTIADVGANDFGGGFSNPGVWPVPANAGTPATRSILGGTPTGNEVRGRYLADHWIGSLDGVTQDDVTLFAQAQDAYSVWGDPPAIGVQVI